MDTMTLEPNQVARTPDLLDNPDPFLTAEGGEMQGEFEAQVQAQDLSTRALLVKLTIGQYGGAASCDLIAEEAAERHGVDADSLDGRVHRLLKEDKAEVQGVLSSVKSLFYLLTLPWDDKGWRVISTENYARLEPHFLTYKSDFEDAVERLLSRHGELEANFKQRLNGLAEQIGFPSRDEMEEKFRLDLQTMPLAASKDLRLQHVSPEQAARIAENVEAHLRAKLSGAQSEIVSRLSGLVEAVVNNLDKDKPRIYDSLVGNLKSAVDVLPSLNISGDWEISRMIRRVKNELATFEVSDLRRDEAAREDAVKAASSILLDLRNYGNKEQ